MKRSPLISVIIAAYNYGRYLREAIDSAIVQTYPSTEIIVINDGSTDDTEKIAQSYGAKIRYFYQEHQGLASPKNRGVTLAQGEYIAFLDADDVWPENRLELMMAPFSNDKSLDMVFGQIRNFLSPELTVEKEKALKRPTEPMSGICPGALLIKKASFLKVGFFEPEWKVTEFLNWHLQAKDLGLKMTSVKELVLFRRLHDENNTLRQRQYLSAEFAKALKASLDRKKNHPKNKKTV